MSVGGFESLDGLATIFDGAAEDCFFEFPFLDVCGLRVYGEGGGGEAAQWRASF